MTSLAVLWQRATAAYKEEMRITKKEEMVPRKVKAKRAETSTQNFAAMQGADSAKSVIKEK